MVTPAASETPAARGHVLVGDDGSRHSRPALDFAVDEAARRGLPLTVLTLHRSALTSSVSIADQLRHERAAVQQAEEQLQQSVSRARARRSGVDVHGVVLVDPRPAEVSARLAGCRLLVVGAHSRHGPAAFAVDSTSGQLLHNAGCPVAMVSDGGPGDPDGPVVVGVDLAASAGPVLRAAATEAALRGCALEVVHALGRQARDLDAAADAAGLALQRLVDADPPARAVPLTTTVARGDPAEALVERAARAALLVVGSRGLLALARLSRESVSRAVLDAGPCPVLLVLDRQRDREQALQ